MPLSLMTCVGLEREIVGDGDDRAEIESWPQPLHSVEGSPCSRCLRQADQVVPAGLRWFLDRHRLSLLFQNGLGDPAAGQRQAVALCATDVSLRGELRRLGHENLRHLPIELFSTT